MNRSFLSDLAFVVQNRCLSLPVLACSRGEMHVPEGETGCFLAPASVPARPLPTRLPPPSLGTILVLDDDANARRSLDQWLRAEGFATTTFASVGELFAALKVEGPACVLLDLELGVHNGFEVLVELRRRNLALPVVILSGHRAVSQVVKAMRLGAFDYLVKPHDPEELRAVIGRALKIAAAGPTLKAEALVRQRVAALTLRERTILALVLRGMLNKQVASELGLALTTIKLHRGRAMRKLGIRSAAELGHLAHLLSLSEKSS